MTFPATPVSTEQIFATLFSLGCSIAGTAAVPSATPLKVTSRVFVQWSQTSASNWPAFYQQETVQTLGGYERGVGRRLLRAWWWLYIPTSSGPQDVVSARMNPYIDALLATLSPTPRGRQFTMGLPGVVHCYPDGALLLDEGLMEPPALVRIPISILVGN